MTRTAPAIDLLVAPEQLTPNVPVFDYVTGSSALVTAISGGNPILAPERRRIDILSLAMKPFAADVRLTVDLVDTLIDGQSASLANVTRPFEAAFADLFARNVAGTLVSVDLRPVNLARERGRKLHWTLSGNVTLDHVRRENRLPAPGTPTPQPPTPKPQMSRFALMTGNYRFSDLLTLRDGQPTLDLLDGASLMGTGGRPRWDLEGTIGGRYGALNLGVYSKLQGSTRVRSELESANLRFSGLTSLTLFSDLDLAAIVKRLWTKRMSVGIQFENILDDRIIVRDGTGSIPNRFQGGDIDSVGRLVRIDLRKLF